VIICAKNAEKTIKACIQSILDQDYPDFEIIIAEDYSTDCTPQFLEHLQSQYSQLNSFRPSIDRLGKKIALQEAIEKSAGEWILLTDADCLAPTNTWISTMLLSLRQETDVVLGYSSYLTQKGGLNAMIRYETIYIALQYFSAARFGMAYMGVGRNLAFKKSAFTENDPFLAASANFSGDDDVIVAALAKNDNVEIVLEAPAHTTSAPKTTISEYFQQKRRHLSPSIFYSPKHQIGLGLLGLSFLCFYFFGILLMFSEIIVLVVVGYLIRLVLIVFTYRWATKILGNREIVFLIPLLDILLALFYAFQLILLPFRKKNW
jgi:glycosyltransferase involved in cell wall biosynthesis